MFGNLFDNIKKIIDENMDKSPEELDKLFFDENGKPDKNIFGNAFEEIKAHASKFKAAFEPMDLSDLTELSDDDIYDNLPMILFDDDANDTKKIARIAYEFDSEFGNGGVSQYFANTRGEFVLELASALEAIGAVKYAKSCDEFIKKYSIRPENFDDTIKDYFKVAESLYPYKELETVIDEFYSTDPLQDYVIKYVREHASEMA